MRIQQLLSRLQSWAGISALAVGSVIIGVAPPASADLVYNLDLPTAGIPTPPGYWGTVTLSQISASSVGVTVTLTSPEIFANGSGDAFSFNLNNATTISFSDMTAGFIRDSGTLKSSPFGTFGYGVCWTSAIPAGSSCGTGTSSPTSSGPLTFTVTDSDGFLSLADFAKLSTLPPGDTQSFFAVDIFANGNTFNVATTGTPTFTCNPFVQDCGGGRSSVPEPASLALLGFGLLGLGFVTQRRRVF